MRQGCVWQGRRTWCSPGGRAGVQKTQEAKGRTWWPAACHFSTHRLSSFSFHSDKREEAGSQVKGGVSSGKEEGAGEAAAGRQRAAEQQEACQERCSSACPHSRTTWLPCPQGAGPGWRWWLCRVTRPVSLSVTWGRKPSPRGGWAEGRHVWLCHFAQCPERVLGKGPAVPFWGWTLRLGGRQADP